MHIFFFLLWSNCGKVSMFLLPEKNESARVSKSIRVPHFYKMLT